MALDLGLCHCERPLALAWSHEQEAHAGSMPVHQRGRLEQRRDSLLPGHARHRNDDLGRAETECLAKLRRRRSGCDSLIEPLDIDAGPGDQPTAVATDHAMAFEESLIIA